MQKLLTIFAEEHIYLGWCKQACNSRGICCVASAINYKYYYYYFFTFQVFTQFSSPNKLNNNFLKLNFIILIKINTF